MSADRRRDFSLDDGIVYLNCANLGPVPRVAVEATRRAVELKTNPHLIDDRSFYAVPDDFRRAVAPLVGAAPADIAVTDSTTFGVMLVVNGLDWRAGDQVAVTARNFPANRFPWQWLERRGVEVVEVPDDPLPEVERFAAALTPRTRVVSLEWVSYRTGLRRDLAGVGALCRERGVLFVVDGTQGVGGLHLDLAATPCDLLVCSSYKWLLGPVGVGFAWVPPATAERLVPYNVNWFRVAGAEDFSRLAECEELELVPGASRFDKNAPASFIDLAGAIASADYLAEVTPRAVEEHVRGLLDRLVAGLPGGYRALGSLRPERRSNILCFAAATPEATRGAYERLRAAGVIVSLRDGAIRVSPGIYNSAEEIGRLLALL